MVSTKFYSDYDEMDVYTNVWANEGRVDIERLKQLEILFLNAIQWNLIVGKNEFYEKLKTVERLLAQKEGLSRGWFTYTELEMLMPSLEIAKQILNYTTILMFSYACSIATIALSSIILASIPTAISVAPRPNITSDNSRIPQIYPLMISPDDKLTTDEEFLVMENVADRNFTINFPLLDSLMRWETKRNYQDITNFQLMPRKYESVPLPW
jgi:hypothetical protein